MPEIPDVITLSTITSDWGNDIRDRAIMRYANAAARTASIPTPTVGDLSFLNDTGLVYVYFGGAWAIVGGSMVEYGGATHDVSAAITTTFVSKASVVFTPPAPWLTYNVTAWGRASGETTTGALWGLQGRIDMSGTSGSVNTGTAGVSGSHIGVGAQHTRSGVSGAVTIAMQVRETSDNIQYSESIINYAARRAS